MKNKNNIRKSVIEPLTIDLTTETLNAFHLLLIIVHFTHLQNTPLFNAVSFIDYEHHDI